MFLYPNEDSTDSPAPVTCSTASTALYCYLPLQYRTTYSYQRYYRLLSSREFN